MIVEDGFPRDAAVDCFEDSTGGRGDIDDARIGFDHGEVIHAAAQAGPISRNFRFFKAASRGDSAKTAQAITRTEERG